MKYFKSSLDSRSNVFSHHHLIFVFSKLSILIVSYFLSFISLLLANCCFQCNSVAAFPSAAIRFGKLALKFFGESFECFRFYRDYDQMDCSF